MNKNVKDLLKVGGAIVAGLVGAIIYRYRGMENNWPRPILQLLFVVPFAFYLWFNFAFPVPDDAWKFGLTLGALVWATLMVLTGHGGWMDLASYTKERKDERLEFLIKWAKPKMSEYWYDVLGLTVNGALITVPVGILTLNPIVALIGALKAPAYMIGWKLFPSGATKPGILDEATEVGEALTGFFMWVSLGVIWLFFT